MRRLYGAWMAGIVCLYGTTIPAHAALLADLTTLPGLKDEGKVIRDVNGIPYISAKYERDVLLLQGYTHAQDRLFQMDIRRRQAEGTLAELLGPSALPSDVQLRTFGLRRAAERSLPILTPEVRDALSAYADGINAYVARNPLPPEYAALEITTFRSWTPVDTLSVLKLLGFSQSFELTDLDRTTLLSQYQAAGAMQGFNGAALFFEDVNRLAPFNKAATIPDAGPPLIATSVSASTTVSGSVPASTAASSSVLGNSVVMDMAQRYLQEVRRLPLVQAVMKNLDDDRGSNEIVVAGNRSITGLPILANDPHPQLSAPSPFYEISLRAPTFSAIGASFPGSPFVVIGNNDYIAWGLNQHLMDVTDVYQERIVPDSSSPSGLSTVYKGALEPVVALPQTFRTNTLGDAIKDNVVTVPAGGPIPAAVLIVPRRNQGPIISLNQAAGTAISVQYAGFSGTREIQAFRSINYATILSEFTTALQSFDVGSQNIAYADKENIAYFVSGEMPLREDLQNGAPLGLPPFFLRNGEGGNEWLPAQYKDPDRALPYEILPFKEMPQLLNPARGVIVNANNDPTGNNRDNNVLNVLRPGGGIRYIGTGYNFDLGIRAGRVEALLSRFLGTGLLPSRKISGPDLQRILADVVMSDAEYFVPLIKQALANAQRAGALPALASLGADARIIEAVQRFGAWDGSAPTGIVEGFDASDQNGIRMQPTQLEIDNSVAATIYSVWRSQIVGQTLGATLAARGLPLTSPRDIQLTAVKNLFDNFTARSGVGVSGINFFDVPGAANPGDRRDIVLLRSLSSALKLLASSNFADVFNESQSQADYRWGLLHRLLLQHPLGGPFDFPPAGGAFPNPLPKLPGIPMDGGLHTVDPGNHAINIAGSNGFTSNTGAARRYLATMKSTGLDAVTDMAGSPSGVPGTRFYANLLPLYLTNETFPLHSDIEKSTSSIFSVTVFKPLLIFNLTK